MKYNKIAMLVASGMMMASVGGTTFGATQGTSTISAEIGAHYSIEGVNDIDFGNVTFADEKFQSGAQEDTFCVYSNLTGGDDQALADSTISVDYNSTSFSTQLVNAGAYTLTANAGKLLRSGGDDTDTLDVLKYSLTLGENGEGHSWSNVDDSLTSCSTQNHRISVGVADLDGAQRSGSYSGVVTLTIAATAT